MATKVRLAAGLQISGDHFCQFAYYRVSDFFLNIYCYLFNL